MYLSLIMPAYMEENTIARTLSATEEFLEGLETSYEIIVVDDGSTDNTRDIASSQKSDHVKVLGYGQNIGKGYAIKEGLKDAGGDLIAFMDADMDIHPGQLEYFLDGMMAQDTDIVVGSKFHTDSKVNNYKYRNLLSSTYSVLNRILFDLAVHDTQAGMKLFKKEVLDEIIPHIHSNQYSFDLEVLLKASNHGYRIVEVPITVCHDSSESSVNIRAAANMLKDTFTIYYNNLKNTLKQ